MLNHIFCIITFVTFVNANFSDTPQRTSPLSLLNSAMTPFPHGNISVRKRRIPMDDKRIVGGTTLTAYSRPYLVYMQYKLNSTTSFMCGGAVYNASFILTAAHCVHALTPEQISTLIVSAGEHSLKSVEGIEQVKRVSRVIVHPGYNKFFLRHDIALLELSTPLNLTTTNVKSIVLNTDKSCPASKDTCFIAGWGQLSEGTGNDSTSDVPNEAAVPVIGNIDCKLFNDAAFIYNIFDFNICAGDLLSGKDICRGDSGGPLVCTCGGTEKHSGIVSWVKKCGSKSLPAVYTRTSCYVEWIESGFEKYPCGGSNGNFLSLGNGIAFLCILSWCAFAKFTYHL